MAPQEATATSSISAKPLEEEARFLDAKLGSYVRHRFKSLNRYYLDVENVDDVKNSAWAKSLRQPAFENGCTGVRIKYLRTTANRIILNLMRKDQQRPLALQKSWDKAMNGWCVVHARDVWDHVSTVFHPIERKGKNSGATLTPSHCYSSLARMMESHSVILYIGHGIPGDTCNKVQSLGQSTQPQQLTNVLPMLKDCQADMSALLNWLSQVSLGIDKPKGDLHAFDRNRSCYCSGECHCPSASEKAASEKAEATHSASQALN